MRDQLFRRLVRQHGFRALAVQDDASVGAALDAYVTDGADTAVSALADAWRPWRTAEMSAALEWIRAFNQDHPDNPVRIFGVKPAQARPADYHAVLEHVGHAAPHRLAELASHLEPIRTAHEIDEHVQRARGMHPGRPFAEHARDALAIVEQLPGFAVLARMRVIVDFHERSVAGRDNYAGDARCGPRRSSTTSAGPATAWPTGTASRTPRLRRPPWAWRPSAAHSPRSAACCATITARDTSP